MPPSPAQYRFFLSAPISSPAWSHRPRAAPPFHSPPPCNLVAPLVTPASPPFQLIGTPTEPQADLLAEVVSRQDHIRRAAIVTGGDGLDEISLAGPTTIRVVEDHCVEQTAWMPEDFGLDRHDSASLRIKSAAESAARLERVFDGEPGPVRDYVLANSAGALWVARCCSLREGVDQAAAAIDSGNARRLIARWRALAPAAAHPLAQVN